ncbi:MAG TPA: LysR family transcriptional regulator [Streptosporangiaceae bacterium]|nr:LysR family transcriptional regulator [Streptosporangiaceae bacterium]
MVAIAETGSFTAAAERCHIAQSALSHQIARLERHLGARLFDRTSRAVRLTDAGRALLRPGRRSGTGCSPRCGRPSSSATSAAGCRPSPRSG